MLDSKVLTLDSMNPNIVKMEFVVSNSVMMRAAQICKEIKQVLNQTKHSQGQFKYPINSVLTATFVLLGQENDKFVRSCARTLV